MPADHPGPTGPRPRPPFLLALLGAPPLSAADFDSALSAYERGDDATAFRGFSVLAEAGVPGAQYNLAVMYSRGEGVAEDDAQAAVWYRRAAEQGFAKAQYNLAHMYDHGEGLPEDDAQAVVWYRRAAEQGLALAQVNLALLHLVGEGTPRDDVQAYAWLALAVAQGHPAAVRAQARLERMMTPDAVADGEALALRLAGRIAPRGSVEATP